TGTRRPRGSLTTSPGPHLFAARPCSDALVPKLRLGTPRPETLFLGRTRNRVSDEGVPKRSLGTRSKGKALSGLVEANKERSERDGPGEVAITASSPVDRNIMQLPASARS